MMDGKVCLVTGATAGLGKVTARVLAEQRGQVVLVGRNERKTARAVTEIKKLTGNTAVSYLLADFASFASIHQLAANFLAQYERLDVLVNNAGAVFMSRQLSEDGIEKTFAVNHLGYFLLTNLLLERLQESAPARIVNVASEAHEPATLDFADLGTEKNYAIMKAYGRSKLANIYFTYELARRLDGTAVTVNALHPGFVATQIGANNIPIIGRFVKWFINRSAIDVETGAKTQIYLATSPDVEGVSGNYFVDCKAVDSSPISYNETFATQLWEISAKVVGLEERN
ncbi:MAG: SDR family oxidoreductase [Chloroflexota bacterium]